MKCTLISYHYFLFNFNVKLQFVFITAERIFLNFVFRDILMSREDPSQGSGQIPKIRDCPGKKRTVGHTSDM